MTTPIERLQIATELDVVAARRKARTIAAALGFSPLDQTRIASAVSEIARNAFDYAKGGTVTFAFDDTARPQAFAIEVRDEGPGIRDLDAVLDGTYRSTTGMGRGILGCFQLMDRCHVDSAPGRGTTVTMARGLPAEYAQIPASKLDTLVSGLREPLAAADATQHSLEEVQAQNRELLSTLSALRERQEELLRLTDELEATNRGVVALYAELDERADEARRADAMKSRFLSNISHELRTPLSSIRALSALLLNRLDGNLSPEQERQVRLIRTSADELSEIVNDLLDLAKIEAGRTEVTPVWFTVSGLFAALRAMLTPLLTNRFVQLIFEDATGLPAVFADEAKLTQVLRNFVSNALKFTERGEIRVGARLEPDREHVRFFVADTGIGIAAEHHELVFEEFGQVQNRLQQHAKGTGLGLPLCRKLSALLGGYTGLESSPGVGSTFYTILPIRYANPDQPGREDAAKERGRGEGS